MRPSIVSPAILALSISVTAAGDIPTALLPAREAGLNPVIPFTAFQTDNSHHFRPGGVLIGRSDYDHRRSGRHKQNAEFDLNTFRYCPPPTDRIDDDVRSFDTIRLTSLTAQRVEKAINAPPGLLNLAITFDAALVEPKYLRVATDVFEKRVAGSKKNCPEERIHTGQAFAIKTIASARVVITCVFRDDVTAGHVLNTLRSSDVSARFDFALDEKNRVLTAISSTRMIFGISLIDYTRR